MVGNKYKMILSFSFIKAIIDLIFKYIPIRFYVKLFCDKEQCWLISERPTEARDNGFFLCKWIRENHPEVRIIYVIKQNSNDYFKVKDLCKTVEYGSIKHWYYYFHASICCDTGWGICCPNSFCYILMRNIFPPQNKRVFLQHGIIKDYMSQGIKTKLNANVFVCGAYPEWKYISENYGYNNNEVRYLGLCRYDYLVNCATRGKFLFMPTWRKNLEKKDDIELSDYYKTISTFLSSIELYDFLEKNDIELIYFLHPHIKNCKNLFDKFANKRIKIHSNDTCDLQKLICDCKALITDFSSIYFDFAYQYKPIIYFHFDYDSYRKNHYEEGYFNYSSDGFGPIVKNGNSLVQEMKKIIDNNWEADDVYKKRADVFFPIRDKCNCQRHYNVLCELEDGI